MGGGVFVLSLDFEMMWGAIFNKPVENGYWSRVPYVETIVQQLLSVFKKYGIHATWATVGAIACQDPEEAVSYASKKIYDPYGKESLLDFINRIPEEHFNLYFQKDLVDSILKTEGQELGTHTFSHLYYQEHTDALEKLDDELKSSRYVLENRACLPVETLVMPKNQIDPEIYDLIKKNGIKNIRGKQRSLRFNEGSLKRIMWYIDAYIPVCGDNTYYPKEIKHDGLNDVRASRFWRTYNKKLALLEPLKIIRIKREMTKAAKEGKIYHLWFHPHNLGKYYAINMKKIEIIIRHFIRLQDAYNMVSLNIKECSSL